MTGMSKVASGNHHQMQGSGSVEQKKQDEIHGKHKRHHNHLGAHQHASEKERLKKLFKELEAILGSKKDGDDKSEEEVESELKKMIKGHVQGNIKTLKNKYGLNDDKLNHIHNLVEADNATAAQGDIVLSGGIAVLYLFMNLLSDIAQFKYLEMQQKAKVSRDAQNMANTVQEQIADVSKGDNPDTTKVSLDPNVIKYMEENDVKVGDQTIDQYLDKKGGGLDDLSNCTFASSNGDGHKLYLSKDTKTGQWSAIDDDARHKLLAAHSKDIVNDLKSISMPIPRPTVNATDGTISVTIGDASQLSRNSKYPSSIKDGTKFSGKVDGAKATFNQLDKGQLDAVKSALENESNRASDYVSQSQLQLQKVMQTYNVTVSLINSMQTMLEEMNKSIAQNIR